MGQGEASSASQLPQFGSPQTAPHPCCRPRKASFKGPPHSVFVAEIRPGPNEFPPPHRAPWHFDHGPRLAYHAWDYARWQEQQARGRAGRRNRQSRLVHHASTRGQLQAPWQTVNQSSFASIGTAFWTVGGIRHRGFLPRRPELPS